uniref:G-protein coupled receptors family 1 profile domain-containing protein n=1 Tax=Strigamia maritima TaxID=126957 RepID=T1JJB5_STRMM
MALHLPDNLPENLSFLINLTCDDKLAQQLFFKNCSSDQSSDDLISKVGVQALFYLLYTIIFTVGIFGNVLVCYVVIRNKNMQTVTNVFITNLALSDVLLCVLGVPFTPLYSFLNNWIFGEVLCHLVSYSQGVSVYISTLTLTSIAIDRFFVIIYPFKPRMKLTTCFSIICSIWLFAVVATLPYGIFMKLIEERGTSYCTEDWPGEKSRQIFGGCTTILQFIVPFIIMTFCYIRVSLKLQDRARAKPGAKSSRKEEIDRERKRRTNRMLIGMVAIFGCSWLPLNLVNLLNDLWIDIAGWKFFYFCFFIAHAIAMSSTCYNPFLYAWLNDNFRKEFKMVLPCCFNGAMQRARLSTFRSERTCNGQETVQETLIHTNSIRANIVNEPAAPAAAYVTATNEVHIRLPKNTADENSPFTDDQV